jgi:hypothetical protein
VAEVLELAGEPLREAESFLCPVTRNSAFRIAGETLDQLGHQPPLVAEVVMNVGPGGADRLGNGAKTESLVPAQNIKLFRNRP